MKTTSARRMSPAVRTLAGVAVLVAGLSGMTACASRTAATASNGAGAGSAATSGAGTTGTASAPGGSAPTATGTGVQEPPASSHPSALPTGGKTVPTVPGNPAGTTKSVSPQAVALAKDGVTLSAQIEWGGCNDKPQLVLVSQDSAKVVVELKETSHGGPGVMCPDHVQEGVATLVLPSPLGSRQLVDGVTGAALPHN